MNFLRRNLTQQFVKGKGKGNQQQGKASDRGQRRGAGSDFGTGSDWGFGSDWDAGWDCWGGGEEDWRGDSGEMDAWGKKSWGDSCSSQAGASSHAAASQDSGKTDAWVPQTQESNDWGASLSKNDVVYSELFHTRDEETQRAVEKHLVTLRALADVKDEATALNIAEDSDLLSGGKKFVYTEIWGDNNKLYYRSSPAQIAVVVRFLERLLPSNQYLSLLFGSHNQKTVHSKSDVDLIYLLEDKVDDKSLEKWLTDVGRRLKKAKEGGAYAVTK